MDPSMQVHKLALEVCLVVPPRQSIHTGCGILFKLVERRLKMRGADVVEERGELLLLPLPCCLPYALQPLGHGFPALYPARAVLTRIPLGPRPWLPRLRGGSLRVVHQLHGYYGGV